MRDVYKQNSNLGDPQAIEKQLEPNAQKLDSLQRDLQKYEVCTSAIWIMVWIVKICSDVYINIWVMLRWGSCIMFYIKVEVFTFRLVSNVHEWAVFIFKLFHSFLMRNISVFPSEKYAWKMTEGVLTLIVKAVYCVCVVVIVMQYPTGRSSYLWFAIRKVQTRKDIFRHLIFCRLAAHRFKS